MPLDAILLKRISELRATSDFRRYLIQYSRLVSPQSFVSQCSVSDGLLMHVLEKECIPRFEVLGLRPLWISLRHPCILSTTYWPDTPFFNAILLVNICNLTSPNEIHET